MVAVCTRSRGFIVIPEQWFSARCCWIRFTLLPQCRCQCPWGAGSIARRDCCFRFSGHGDDAAYDYGGGEEAVCRGNGDEVSLRLPTRNRGTPGSDRCRRALPVPGPRDDGGGGWCMEYSDSRRYVAVTPRSVTRFMRQLRSIRSNAASVLVIAAYKYIHIIIRANLLPSRGRRNSVVNGRGWWRGWEGSRCIVYTSNTYTPHMYTHLRRAHTTFVDICSINIEYVCVIRDEPRHCPSLFSGWLVAKRTRWGQRQCVIIYRRMSVY